MSFLPFCKTWYIIRCGGRGAHLVYVSLQWGFHSSWISAGRNLCWTTHATSTWTRTRASRSECGRSFAASSFVHRCLKMRRAGRHSGQVTLQRRGRPLKDVLRQTLFVCHAWSLSRRHTLPVSQWEEAAGKRPEWYRETLKDGNPVIIYLHGNLGSRWDESSLEVLELMLRNSSVFQRPRGLSRGTMASKDCG